MAIAFSSSPSAVNTYVFYAGDVAPKESPGIGRGIGALPYDCQRWRFHVTLLHVLWAGHIELRPGSASGLNRQRQCIGRRAGHVQNADERGNGTVPVRSGNAPAGQCGAQVCVPYCAIELEGAYKVEKSQQVTHWAITKIAHRVKQTSMAYKT